MSDVLAAIEDELPNGFHDAYLESFTLSRKAGEFEAKLAIDISVPAAGQTRAEFRLGRLLVEGVGGFRCDLLGRNPGGPQEGEGVTIVDAAGDARDLFGVSGAASRFAWKIFFKEANSFLYLSGDSASWEWDE